MTLDPRTQLAITMLTGLTNHQEPLHRKRQPIAVKPERLRKEQRAMEALTQALLDPCTTVQEAVLDALLQDTMIDSPSLEKKDRSSGS